MISHLNKKNKPINVNISNKKKSKRIAIAEGHIQFTKSKFNKIKSLKTKKGKIEDVAIIAGILGAKKTSELIPLSHNIQIENIEINIESIDEKKMIIIRSTVRTTGKTGVEMEALTAVSTACLTVYDMCKSIDKKIEIKNIRLIEKRGGKTNFKL